MGVSIATFNQGDTNYIANLNSNFAALKTAVEALQASLTGSSGAQVSFATLLEALFGSDVVFVGKGSYSESHSGSTITLQPGYVWKPSSSLLVQSTAVVNVSFTGQPAGTYYIQVDNGGVPSRVTSSTEPLYTVVWSGSAFTSVTKNAKYLFTAQEETDALSSTHFATTYAELNNRLDAIEALL